MGQPLVGFASNPAALKQVWLYVAAPLIGAGAAGWMFSQVCLLPIGRRLCGAGRRFNLEMYEDIRDRRTFELVARLMVEFE